MSRTKSKRNSRKNSRKNRMKGGNSKPRKRYSHPNACSFGRANNFHDGKTCFTKGAIKDIARAWNMSGGDPKISNIDNKSKQQLHKDLRERLVECNDEWCWLNHPKIEKMLKNNKEVQFSFGPAIPPGKYEWLRTSDIDFVGDQIEYFYPHFKYLGAFGIDFQNTDRKIFANPTKHFRDGVTMIGAIFNTDPSYKRGQHWIAAAADSKTKTVYFFDSVGKESPRQVKQWAEKFPGYKFVENDIQHQFKNSECGIYGLHFLDLMASGVPFSKVTKKIVKDEEMNKNRKKYFNAFVTRK